MDWTLLLVFLSVITGHPSLSLGTEFETAKWRWECHDQECIKVLPSSDDQIQSAQMSLSGCQSLCGKAGSMWPIPRSFSLGSRTVAIVKPALDSTVVEIKAPSNDAKLFVKKSFKIFSGYFSRTPFHQVSEDYKDVVQLKLDIRVARAELNLDLDTVESYQLVVAPDSGNSGGFLKVQIEAQSVFGVRHALETLSQLISFDDVSKSAQIVESAEIKDNPSYPYRSLLLDTGRNFFTVDSIKTMIDGMSYDKMNVFHWHMNEQTSFPFVSESVPELTKYGAYSAEKVYHPHEVQDIVDYAHERGVMVVPEFDAPAHAVEGWVEIDNINRKTQKNYMDLIVCDKKSWDDGQTQLSASPPGGQLNPVNPKVYEILEKLYKDFNSAFTTKHQPIPMFHMGGDEIFFSCWAEDKNITNWLSKHGFPTDLFSARDGYLALWSHFQEKAKEKLEKSNLGKKYKHGLILWTSELAKPDHIAKYLPKEDYVIQVWTKGNDRWISDLLNQGYQLIFSNFDAWYLDCGFGAWIYDGDGKENNWCSPFKGWKTMYMNSPRDIVINQGNKWTDEIKRQVMGGAATMWSEQVDENGVEARIWPRTSAVAERLWSDPETSWQLAERRILEHRQRLVDRGIRADVIQPEFCRQNQGWCYQPSRNIQSFPEPPMRRDFRELDHPDRPLILTRKPNQELSEYLRLKLNREQQQFHAVNSPEKDFLSAKESFSSVHTSFGYILLLLFAFSASFVLWTNRRTVWSFLMRKVRQTKSKFYP